MTMNSEEKTKVEEYISKNEQEKWYWKIAETIADLVWVEKETKENFLDKWLKNDKSLLAYAELVMKGDKLTIWESLKQKLLEIKLSITCPYFADFKDFLEDLKRWSDTNISSSNTSTTETSTESIETSTNTFCGTNIRNIESVPFGKNHKTWVTWCSKTARFNWYNFGLNLPSWNAYDAWTNPGKDSISTIPMWKRNKRPDNSWEWISVSDLKSQKRWNYADIYTSSKSWYGHRAAAFKDDKWHWYVLDPYSRVNWRLDSTPKRLEDYLKTRKILKANIYESKWYTKKSNHEDKWSWYEWENH